jgi:hypothetical protein
MCSMGQINHQEKAREIFGRCEVSLVFKNSVLGPRLVPRNCKASLSLASR